jgi:hypothetical protein
MSMLLQRAEEAVFMCHFTTGSSECLGSAQSDARPLARPAKASTP